MMRKKGRKRYKEITNQERARGDNERNKLKETHCKKERMTKIRNKLFKIKKTKKERMNKRKREREIIKERNERKVKRGR